MANPQVVLDFIANTAGLSKAFAETQRQAGGTGKAFGKLGKAAVVAGGAAGLGLLAGVMHTGIEEFSEAQKVGAQTTAVIKSTGGAANVTAAHVADLSEAMMKKSGVDDEAIQSGQNMLLTFSSIRNEVGKGNKVYDQATQTMLDMSVALGQDTTQSAMQLGKALNDPVKGMTALRRVGVQFTDDQAKQIKAMVAAGDTMGAQKLILAELNREFGGSAEAMGKTLPGQVNILKQSFSNLAGEMVGAVAPAMQAVFGFMAEHPGLVKALTFAVLGLAAAMVVLNVALAVSAVVASPVALVILAIVAAVAALAAAAYLLYANWDGVVAFLAGVWETIKTAVMDAVGAVVGFVRSNWPLLLGIILGPLGLIVAAVVTHWSQIRSAITTAVNAVKSVVTSVFQAIQGVVETVSGAIQSAIETAWNAAKAVVETAVGAIRTVVAGLTTIFNAAKTAVTNFADALKGPLEAAAGVAKGALSGISGVISAIAGAFDSAASAVGRFVGALSSIPSKISLPSLPHIPGLAEGGIVKSPTLAFVGERGPEAVVPLKMFRNLVRMASRDQMTSFAGGSQQPIVVNVRIGDTELKELVTSQVVDVNSGIARTLLAGGLAG